jgi:hypothetical protein
MFFLLKNFKKTVGWVEVTLAIFPPLGETQH